MAVRPRFGAHGSVAALARTTLTVTKPATCRTGDVLKVDVLVNSSTVTPVIAGFTALRQTNVTASKAHQLVTLTRRLVDGDPSSWAVTWDGTSIICSALWRAYIGCPASGTYLGGTASAASAANVTTVPHAAATATGAGLVVYTAGAWTTTVTPSQPVGHFYGVAGGRMSGWETDQLAAGATPTPSPRTGSSDAWTSTTIVLLDGALPDPAFNVPMGLCGITGANVYRDAVALGVSHLRVDFGPGDSQAAADARFASAADAGLALLPILIEYRQISTIDKDAYAAYTGTFVARYGPGGAFWSARGRDGQLAPTWIEIQNEPYGWWFFTTPEADHYADLFIRSVRAGRAANAACRYLFAGIDRYYPRGGSATEWIAPAFAAQPTLGTYIDGVTVHLYGTRPLDLPYYDAWGEWSQLDEVASYLVTAGLDVPGRVRMWVTEYGFTTASATGSPTFGISEADQARQHLEALRLLHGRWSDLLGGAFLFKYQDGIADDREGRFGVMGVSGSPKPAWTALDGVMGTYTSGLIPAVTGACRQRIGDAWVDVELRQKTDAGWKVLAV
jgi:hypothetical protein